MGPVPRYAEDVNGEPVEIREVRPQEYAEAGRVAALSYREFVRPGEVDWDAYLGSIADVAGRVDRTVVLVAVSGGRLLGCVTLEVDRTIGDDDGELEPGTAHVRMLGVDPEARGRGVGRALMMACVDLARARGKRDLTLRTTERMLVAQRMYAAMGFRRDPDHDMFFPDLHLLAFRLPLGTD